jgi:hypothetical protein
MSSIIHSFKSADFAFQCAEGEARRTRGSLLRDCSRIEFPEALNRHFKKDSFSLRNVWLLRGTFGAERGGAKATPRDKTIFWFFKSRCRNSAYYDGV